MTMVIKKQSAAEIAKVKAARTKELVLAMLDWHEIDHFDFVADMAKLYLAKQCGPDTAGQQRLMSNPTFWKWWNNQWSRRDADFVDQCVGETDQENLLIYYRFIHSAERVSRIKPHKILMETSFSKPVQAKEVAV